MPAPIVSWWNEANDTQQTSWDLGVVDAGSVSPDETFLIWNNRSGAEDVSKMENCTITTKDSAGGDTGPLVAEKWIEAKVDSAGEGSFTAVGGTETHPIGAAGSEAGAQEILGGANEGDIANDNNFTQVTLHANVPPTAAAGTVDFLVRVSYQYV